VRVHVIQLLFGGTAYHSGAGYIQPREYFGLGFVDYLAFE
jgi:hypothetical protein